MAKWYGKIGYADTVEIRPGVFKEQITEREYFGDVLHNNRRLQTSDQVNDNINVSNRISIIADPYANENFHTMRYLSFMGTNWKVSSIEVTYPRLVLTLGGVYNG